MDKKSLQDYILKNIPILGKLDFHVRSVENGKVVISAPFLPHVNHQNSVFGGSLGGILLLAGWAHVKYIMDGIDPSANVVVQNSNVRYMKPVKNDFYAVSKEIPKEHLDKFLKTFKRFGKAKIRAGAGVWEENGLEELTEFEGDFVVFKGKEK
jgi:thioesterase domain-containing protein